MRVAFVQTSPVLGMTRQNLESAFALIERVRDADLVVLPELFHSGYAIRDPDEARSLAVSRNSSEPLAMCIDAARDFKMAIVGGFLELEERSGKLFNSAWLIDGSGVIAAYRKVHLFDREKDVFEPGTSDSPIKFAGGARIGMQVCFDWAFPEPWGRLAWGGGDGKGAQIIAHPANLVLPEACPLTLRARAIENRVFIVSAGRVGSDPGPTGRIEFRGGSRILAPDGQVLAAGPDDKIGADIAVIDPSWADDKFITPRNHVLRERFEKSES